MTHRLVTLREQPRHLPVVAGWIHRQWWSDTFVLMADGAPAGSVCLHETEAPDRPDYRPYLGALFVTPACRGRGFGAVLVRATEAQARRLGHPALYLNAAETVTPFYEALGWRVVERGYGRKRLNILQRTLREQGDCMRQF
jgi:GNAT superfamily N-acetyltransferase